MIKFTFYRYFVYIYDVLYPGPSHSNPSVIVAKILEKLRDHEKESVLMNSYHPDFKKRSSVDQFVIEDQPKKFSKVARNVLTKIRFVCRSTIEYKILLVIISVLKI